MGIVKELIVLLAFMVILIATQGVVVTLFNLGHHLMAGIVISSGIILIAAVINLDHKVMMNHYDMESHDPDR